MGGIEEQRKEQMGPSGVNERRPAPTFHDPEPMPRYCFAVIYRREPICPNGFNGQSWSAYWHLSFVEVISWHASNLRSGTGTPHYATDTVATDTVATGTAVVRRRECVI
jgi:hypothetical protein